jgi:cullin-associated NEDD8-dissociated protein 1
MNQTNRDIKESMSSSSVQLRAAVTTAVKYAVVDPSVEYTQYLKPIISKFLQLLEDTDLVRILHD